MIYVYWIAGIAGYFIIYKATVNLLYYFVITRNINRIVKEITINHYITKEMEYWLYDHSDIDITDDLLRALYKKGYFKEFLSNQMTLERYLKGTLFE